MFGSMKVLSVIAGLGLMAGLIAMPARAEEAKKETGSVAGVVVDASGKAVAGANVALLDKSQMPDRPKREKNAADDDANKPKRPEPTAKGKTDADGKFSLADVPVGEYVVIARSKEAGNARADVTVTAGQASHVELTLQPKGEKKQKAN